VSHRVDPVDVSIVVPVYRCDECLVALYERVVAALEPVTTRFELILVDDRSPDDGWKTMKALADRDSRVRPLRLSRNFGQHPAITAGLAHARGRWTVVMDCDLQHPPEEIPRLLAKARDGYDVVFARRRGGRHSWFRKRAAAAYFALLNAAMKTQMDPDIGNFSVISARAREAFLQVRDKDRQYLMILWWIGYPHATIEFEFAERYAGRSSYSLAGLIAFALEGLFFQTTTVLRWIVYAGFVISSAGGALAVFFVVNYFAGSPYPGWTSLGVLVTLLSGFTIVSTGVTGLYVARIFVQVKDRPLFLVDEEFEPELRPHAPAPPVGSRSPSQRSDGP
jgi:dolichol-phosphate mannosyltransferase